jgi:hypothetical protein
MALQIENEEVEAGSHGVSSVAKRNTFVVGERRRRNGHHAPKQLSGDTGG